MKANVGDWLVVKSGVVGHRNLRGLITEVRSPEGEPPYRVRWLDSDDESTVYPGPDAIVMTAAEQHRADARERARFATMRAALAARAHSR